MDIQPSRPTLGAASRHTCSLVGLVTWVLVAVISAYYFVGITPGHIFAQDDFAAYVMHAANQVEQRPYTQIHYLTNPEAPWISPASGFPPAYPLLLASVYWRWE